MHQPPTAALDTPGHRFLAWRHAADAAREQWLAGKLSATEYTAELDRLGAEHDRANLRAELGALSGLVGVPFNVDAVVGPMFSEREVA